MSGKIIRLSVGSAISDEPWLSRQLAEFTPYVMFGEVDWPKLEKHVQCALGQLWDFLTHAFDCRDVCALVEYLKVAMRDTYSCTLFGGVKSQSQRFCTLHEKSSRAAVRTAVHKLTANFRKEIKRVSPEESQTYDGELRDFFRTWLDSLHMRWGLIESQMSTCIIDERKTSEESSFDDTVSRKKRASIYSQPFILTGKLYSFHINSKLFPV
jgi:hypothetical protein